MADLFAAQNIPTNQQQVTQLPADVQFGLDQAALQRALAQALLQRGMQVPEGQTIQTGGGAPNHYVKPSAFQYLASLANTAAGASGLGASNANLRDIMQKYQGQQNAAQSAAAQTLGGGPTLQNASIPQGQPTGQAPQSPIPTGLTSDQALASYKQMKASGIPATMAEADKLLPLIGELRNRETANAAENARSVYGEGAKVATPAGLVANANNTGLAGGNLQAPGESQTRMQNGVLERLNPRTNVWEPVAENPLSTMMTRKVQETQMGIIQDRLKAAESGQGDAISAGNLAATGKALQEIIPKAQLGPQALQRAELQRWGALLGFPLPQGTTYTQLAHQLSLSFIGMAKGTAGFQGRLSTQEANWLREANASNLDVTNPAFMQIAHNAEIYGNTQVATHNKRMQNFEGHARAQGLSGTFTPYSVTPDMIAPIGTGESFLPQPTVAPTSKPNAVDMRGQIAIPK